MSDKQVAVVDSGTLISMASVKLPNENGDKVNGLNYLTNTYEVHVPYSVVEEVNTMAADPRGELKAQGQENIQKSAQVVMQNADVVFEKIHYDYKNRNPNTDIKRFDVAGLDDGRESQKLAELDSMEKPWLDYGFYKGKETYDEVKGDIQTESHIDAGERDCIALAAKSADTDEMETVDVVLSDDIKSLNDINHIVNEYHQQSGSDENVDVMTSGGYLGSLAKSDKPVSQKDAIIAGANVVTKRDFNQGESITADWDSQQELSDAVKHLMGGTVAHHATFTEEDFEQAKNNAAVTDGGGINNMKSGGFRGYPVQKSVPCGKNCSGCPHGPYTYDVWRQDGKTHWAYRGKG